MQVALRDWGDARITLALDTTLLFKRWCVICVSLLYRGRAVPLSWRIIRHGSSTVGNQEIYPVLASVQCLLVHLPQVEEVCTDADRGFLDHTLMGDFTTFGWRWMIRGKGPIHLFDQDGTSLGQFQSQLSQHGLLIVRHGVYVTGQKYGPVNIAAVRPFGQRDPWFIVSDQPCHTRTFAEYHQRTQVEEGFLDLKSGVFNLEDTRLNQAHQLEKLWCVLGMAYLMVLSEGTAVTEQGKRREVDPHWARGLSYAQLGLRAIRQALTRRMPVLERLRLSQASDPEPSRRRRSPIGWNVIQGFS